MTVILSDILCMSLIKTNYSHILKRLPQDTVVVKRMVKNNMPQLYIVAAAVIIFNVKYVIFSVILHAAACTFCPGNITLCIIIIIIIFRKYIRKNIRIKIYYIRNFFYSFILLRKSFGIFFRIYIYYLRTYSGLFKLLVDTLRKV